MKTINRILSVTLLMTLVNTGCQRCIFSQSDGLGISKLNRTPANFSSPVWSPTGEEIAVANFSYPQYLTGIYKFNVVTGREELILEVSGNISVQSWSPDGSKIAFSSFG